MAARTSQKSRTSFSVAGTVKCLLLGAVFLSGAVLSNLDRLGSFGYWALPYKSFFPKAVRVWLPGESRPFAEPMEKTQLWGTVSEVYDGDTVTLLTEQQKFKIRFYGIDAPEAAQEFGLPSRDALRRKILGKRIRVDVLNRDPYGRAVGNVYLENRLINREMVREGYAWHYRAYAKHEVELAAAEQSARKEHAGLWIDSNPVPPWDYRKAGKE